MEEKWKGSACKLLIQSTLNLGFTLIGICIHYNHVCRIEKLKEASLHVGDEFQRAIKRNDVTSVQAMLLQGKGNFSAIL